MSLSSGCLWSQETFPPFAVAIWICHLSSLPTVLHLSPPPPWTRFPLPVSGGVCCLKEASDVSISCRWPGETSAFLAMALWVNKMGKSRMFLWKEIEATKALITWIVEEMEVPQNGWAHYQACAFQMNPLHKEQCLLFSRHSGLRAGARAPPGSGH